MFWVAMETHPELNSKIELMVSCSFLFVGNVFNQNFFIGWFGSGSVGSPDEVAHPRAHYFCQPIAGCIRWPAIIFCCNWKFDRFCRAQVLFEWFGTKAFLPSNRIVKLMSKYLCDQAEWEADVCENIFFLISGADPTNFNKVRLAPRFHLFHFCNAIADNNRSVLGENRNSALYGDNYCRGYSISS